MKTAKAKHSPGTLRKVEVNIKSTCLVGWRQAISRIASIIIVRAPSKLMTYFKIGVIMKRLQKANKRSTN